MSIPKRNIENLGDKVKKEVKKNPNAKASQQELEHIFAGLVKQITKKIEFEIEGSILTCEVHYELNADGNVIGKIRNLENPCNDISDLELMFVCLGREKSEADSIEGLIDLIIEDCHYLLKENGYPSGDKSFYYFINPQNNEKVFIGKKQFELDSGGFELNQSWGTVRDIGLASHFPKDPKIKIICDMLNQAYLCIEVKDNPFSLFNEARFLGYHHAMRDFHFQKQAVDNKTMIERAIQGTSQKKATITKKYNKPTQSDIAKQILLDNYSVELIKNIKPNILFQKIGNLWGSYTNELNLPTNYARLIKKVREEI